MPRRDQGASNAAEIRSPFAHFVVHICYTRRILPEVNMRPRWLLLALSLLAGCAGAPHFESETCARRYDACTDACADQCYAANSLVDESRRSRTITGHRGDSAGCSACASICRREAERCESATSAPP